MRKLIVVIVATAFSYAGFCQLVSVPNQGNKAKSSQRVRAPINPEERAARNARRAEIQMREFGGYIMRPNSQKGVVVCVDCQQRIPREWIEEVLTYFRDESRFMVDYKKGEFCFPSPNVEGNATLFLVDDANLPAILVAPENRWALLNFNVVAKEKRPAFFQARSKKQISRALALLCGASNSQFPGALTRGIVNEEDLDKNIDYVLPMDIFKRMRSYMEPLGVTPAIYSPYDSACEEGWAPPPTNDVQKAIWDKVHALPTAPIKIKPEAKKVRE